MRVVIGLLALALLAAAQSTNGQGTTVPGPGCEFRSPTTVDVDSPSNTEVKLKWSDDATAGPTAWNQTQVPVWIGYAPPNGTQEELGWPPWIGTPHMVRVEQGRYEATLTGLTPGTLYVAAVLAPCPSDDPPELLPWQGASYRFFTTTNHQAEASAQPVVAVALAVLGASAAVRSRLFR